MGGYTKNVSKGEYKTKSGQLIEESKTVKDLGILTSKDVSFDEHLDDLVLSSNIKAGLLLRTFNTYSLERRRERFLIQNAWQQIEGKKENILGLETGKVGRRRCIRSTTIPTALSEKFRTKSNIQQQGCS